MTIDIHALSGAYAIDALDDVEREQFELHLAQCADCRSEVASLQEASALLAETTMVTPSADLRRRVLASAASVRPLPPIVEHAGPGAHAARPTASNVTALEPRRRRRAASFLAAAAAAVIIGSGGYIAVQQLNDSPPEDHFSAIAEAPDARTFAVSLGNGGSAAVTVSKKRNEAYIATKGMPAAPTGKQYVLWFKHGATLTAAGVMPQGSDNKVLFSGDAATADGAAVSIEDAGTTPSAPSSDIAAAFSFA